MIWYLLANSNILVEILYKNFEETVKLKEWKSSLYPFSKVSLDSTDREERITYHRDRTCSRQLLSNFDIKQGSVLRSLIKI